MTDTRADSKPRTATSGGSSASTRRISEPIGRASCLPQLIRTRAAHDPDDVAIEQVDNGHMSWCEIDATIADWTAALRNGGIGPDEPVVSMLRPSFDVIGVWLGTAWLRALFVPVNVDYKGPLLTTALELARARVIVVDADLVGTVDDALGRATERPSTVTLVVCGAHGGLPEPSTSGVVTVARDDFLTVGAGHGGPGGAERVAEGDDGPQAHDVAAILFTSGTTGPSKGVIVHWQQLHDMAWNLGPLDAFEADDAFYAPYPWHHASAMFAVYLMALCGGRTVLRERFSATRFLRDVREHRCTATLLLGAMASFLMTQPLPTPDEPDDAESPLDKVLILPLVRDHRAFAARFGVRLRTYYSMTELSGPITSDGYGELQDQSCGTVQPGYVVRVVDEHDVDVPIGDVGELVVRADVPWTTMGGYWRNPQATVEAWRNLWFHTGDAFRRDADGNYFFVDRLKDAIRRRGENVSSHELESVVTNLDTVAECAAVAWPSEHGEDEIRLFLVPTAPAAHITELWSQLQAALPRHMLPDLLEIVEELPMTPTGKVQKNELRARPLSPSTSRRHG